MIHGLEDDLYDVIGPDRCTGWQDSGQSYLEQTISIRLGNTALLVSRSSVFKMQENSLKPSKDS